MNSEQNNDINQGKSANSSRRKFLQKASAGVAISAIPVKSVWAVGGGLLNSIQASNHGSGWTGQNKLALQKVNYWKNEDDANVTFVEAFGSSATPRIKSSTNDIQWDNGILQKKRNGQWKNVKIDDVEVTNLNITLKFVMRKDWFKGADKNICAMYLNAKFDGDLSHGVHFPVLTPQNGRVAAYNSLADFGDALYTQMQIEPYGFESQLGALLNENGV